MVTKSGYCVLVSLCMTTKQAFYTATTLIQKIWQYSQYKVTPCGTVLCFLNCSLGMQYTSVLLNHTNHSYFPKQCNDYAPWICLLDWFSKTIDIIWHRHSASSDRCAISVPMFQTKTTPTKIILLKCWLWQFSNHCTRILRKRSHPLKQYIIIVISGYIIFKR